MTDGIWRRAQHSYRQLMLIRIVAAAAGLLMCGAPLCGPGVGLLYGQDKTSARTPAGKSGAEAPVRPFATDIRGGILTIDGMVAKVKLNYDIHHNFLYFTVPGVGTAIVAQSRFLNSAPQKRAFHDNVLTVNASGHVVELTGSGPLVGKGVDEAWVAIDPLYGAGKYPEMGFGDALTRPYTWPGALAEPAQVKTAAGTETVVPPPVPVSLRPRMAISSSYTVVVPGTEPPKLPKP